MKFWKGNRLDAEFDADPAEVAARFTAWRRSQPAHYRDGMRLERQLRDWMTRPDGLDAVWADESDQGFGAVFDAAYDLVYGTSRV